jgi:hypothetical protein
LDRLRKRIWKTDPLFADQFIEKAITEKPWYFDPVEIGKEDQRRQQKITENEADYLAKLSNARF